MSAIVVEKMTPKERLKAIAEGRPYDRIPHGFGVGDAAARVTGIKVSEFHQNSQKQIDASVAAYRKYDLDGVSAHVLLPGLFGAKIAFPDYSTPYTEKPAVLERDDLRRDFLGDVKTNPLLQVFWRVVDGLYETVEDEAPVMVTMEGPFSTAGRTIGTENLLRRVVKDPEYVHAFLDKIVDVQTTIVEALRGRDVSFGIFDPVSSCTVISVKHYREFAKPALTRLFDAMISVSGRKPMAHICGNTYGILHDIVETGAGSISVDNIMDLEIVKREIGEKAAIVGNVKPADTMLYGTPQDVRADLKTCFQKAWDTPAGYVPGFGCGLPIDTPPENLLALTDALRQYGKWPLDPANFS